MKPEEAINQIEELMTIDNTALVYLPDFRDAFELAVKALKEQRTHGECGTCKHFVKGGLDGNTYVCEHPDIEQDDYYNYACLMVEEKDFCSSYEPYKKEGE